MGEFLDKSNDINIGQKIRQIRKIRNISLQQFAEETGMSYSYLSGLENGKHSISVNTLQKLAAYFKVDLVNFLKTNDDCQILLRAGEGQKTITEEEIVFNVLTSQNAKNLQVTVVDIPVNTPTERHIHKHPEGEEFIYVLEGEIVFLIGENKYVLNKGDSVHFAADKEHVICAEGKYGKILLISSPPNGRIIFPSKED